MARAIAGRHFFTASVWIATSRRTSAAMPSTSLASLCGSAASAGCAARAKPALTRHTSAERRPKLRGVEITGTSVSEPNDGDNLRVMAMRR